MIYFDLTRLLEWQTSYTGMERVAYELASRLTHKGKAKEVRLAYFVPGVGFVDITSEVIWEKDSRVTSKLARHESIRQVAKKQPLKATKLYHQRSQQRKILAALPKIEPMRGNTIFVSDGLWGQQDYTEALLSLAAGGVKLAHMVHDLVPLVVPHVCHDYVTKDLGNYFEKIAPHIDVLVSISQNTERDFLTFYGSLCKQTMRKSVIHHGEDFQYVPSKMPACVKGVKDFILCVGTVEIRKNHLLFYQVYRLAAERGIELPPLVIVGKEGWLVEQTMKLMKDDPVVKDKFIFAGPLPDPELAWCYENCLFTALASIYEGWGMQVAESLHYGKVCVVSNAGPLPEVGGDLNVYFSPYDVADCLGKVKGLLDQKVRQEYEKRVKHEFKTTSWESTAAIILAALRKA